jgi:hypothetical protein
MKLKDIRDQEYGVGDTVAHATRCDSSAALSVGVVRKIVRVPHPWKAGQSIVKLKVEVTHCTGYARVPRNVTWECLERIVKL